MSKHNSVHKKDTRSMLRYLSVQKLGALETSTLAQLNRAGRRQRAHVAARVGLK